MLAGRNEISAADVIRYAREHGTNQIEARRALEARRAQCEPSPSEVVTYAQANGIGTHVARRILKGEEPESACAPTLVRLYELAMAADESARQEPGQMGIGDDIRAAMRLIQAMDGKLKRIGEALRDDVLPHDEQDLAKRITAARRLLNEPLKVESARPHMTL